MVFEKDLSIDGMQPDKALREMEAHIVYMQERLEGKIAEQKRMIEKQAQRISALENR